MCGISGFIDFNKKSSLEQLQAMNRSMEHRGPDGEGYFFEEIQEAQIGLAHRRLSIIDLSSHANQPMFYENYALIFNGEIYNFQEIKDELLTLGHIFHTQSDTEVILHAFQQWHTRCVEKMVGMFAFVLLDKKKGELYAFRDRAGVKPFFYYWHEGLFLFGSELKVLMQHSAFKKSICLDSLASFMNYGYVPTPNSIFEHTHKLKPGHFIEISLQKKNFEIKKYWNVLNAYQLPKLDIGYDEAIEETEKILKKAFQYRMVADVPVGVFLSGGYDSTCVTAMLQAQASQKIKTFTIGVGDQNLNEAPFAKQISDYIGTDHQELYCTEKDALDIVPQLPHFFDEPFADSSAIPTILVSKLAAGSVKVALSADAGDEIFGGYNRYAYYQKIRFLEKFPQIGKNSISWAIRMAQRGAQYVVKHPLTLQRMDKMQKLISNPSASNIMDSFTHHFGEKELRDLFSNDFAAQHSLFDPHPKHPKDNLSAMMAIDYQTYLLDDILTKVDRATMSQSIEGREPFLDQHIIEWAAQLPNHFKYHQGTKKRILRDITHRYIPKEMMDRPKMGFAIPLQKWLQEGLLRNYMHFFDNNFIAAQGLFNPPAIQDLLRQFERGNGLYTLRIWHYLMFQMWYESYMKG
jgi:asparagine synthase (glutamine-hydrolysing)